MIWTNTKRIFRSGFVDFWRNGFVSLSSVLVMIITLSVICSLILTNVVLKSSLEQIKNKVDIDVTFVTAAQESDVLAVKKSLEALPEVESVAYVSSDQALQNFQNKHQNEQTTLQALNELGSNPFGATLEIKTKDPSQYAGVADFLQNDNTLSASSGSTTQSIIYQVNYYQNKDAIDRLTLFINSGEKIGLVLTIALILISILITFNTIRLAIFISKDEISVMRLVGASGKYVRGPFVVSGILYGILAGIITLIIFWPVTYYLGPKTVNFFGNVNVYSYYRQSFGKIFLIIMGSGIVIGAVSSWLAVRKHLKV